jgi:hypothetical protein
MSDICATVLAPFQKSDFLKRDPLLNGVPVPGLLYADDLVLFCLNQDLLRERLRRLCRYADQNTLTVNVKKCEVVVFGDRLCAPVFKFKREVIPVRRSCKYLGVWVDGDLSGRSLAAAIEQKFISAVPVFFGLCRRLRVARLDLVHRLASALVFSLLYGCEFLRRLDILEACETAWWKGVRSFYGLPNGVSAVCVRLLFPRVSLIEKALVAKLSLVHRATQPRDTILPEAFICDRGFLLARHRKGFSQSISDWCQFLGVGEAFGASDLGMARAVVRGRESARRDADWLTFSTMSSTTMAARIFESREALYGALLEASKFGSLGVRAFLLAITGSLSVSYAKSRFCFCGCKFTFEHFLSCPLLGSCALPSLCSAVHEKDWRGAAVVILSRFEVYVHYLRGGELRDEEADLFSLLNEPVSGSVESIHELFEC